METDKVIRGKSGKGYKITTFSKQYANSKGHGRHYLALFDKEKTLAKEGWYTNNLSHAKGDGKAWITEEGRA